MLTSVRRSEAERRLQDGNAIAINAMAAVPDGRYVVIGREDGRLERDDAVDFRNGAWLNQAEFDQRLAVEALALSRDGRTLAAITFAHKPLRDELPRTECNVTVRTLPDGADIKVVRTTGDVARRAGV